MFLVWVTHAESTPLLALRIRLLPEKLPSSEGVEGLTEYAMEISKTKQIKCGSWRFSAILGDSRCFSAILGFAEKHRETPRIAEKRRGQSFYRLFLLFFVFFVFFTICFLQCKKQIVKNKL